MNQRDSLLSCPSVKEEKQKIIYVVEENHSMSGSGFVLFCHGGCSVGVGERDGEDT